MTERGSRPPRPVRIASVLWIVLGAIMVLGTLGLLDRPESIMPVAYVLTGAIGLVIVGFGIAMRRGAGNGVRITLTVFGGLLGMTCWPLFLVVPAIILQFKQESQAWFVGAAGAVGAAGGAGYAVGVEHGDQQQQSSAHHPEDWHDRGEGDPENRR